MLTFVLTYLDAHNYIDDPGSVWWYVWTIVLDLGIVVRASR